jgi:hypothetical protein
MILVRITFQAKFGKAGELAKEMLAGAQQVRETYGGGSRSIVLTDMSGRFDTVVQEIEVESLAEWERTRAEMFTRPEFRESFARTAPLIESGTTEFYNIEG